MIDPAHPDKLLGKTFECTCGRTHTVPVQRIVYDQQAIHKLPAVLTEHIGKDSIAIVADERTWRIAGEAAAEVLGRAGWTVTTKVLPDGDHGQPVCDDITFDRLLSELAQADTFLAVGSGVVNDLTKWVAFERRAPYAVLATAATMNGYAASNVAPALKGVKSIIFAEAPAVVLAVPSQIADAPFELTAAGVGDVIAKPISTADWVMNNVLFDEYFCQDTTAIISALERRYVDRPEDIPARDPDAIESLFMALLYSGVAMTMVGTSAPASGGEHMLSHTLDMMSSVDGQPHDLHGRQVGLGTILAAALYERLFEVEEFRCIELPGRIDAGFWGRLAGPTAEQYEAKQPLLSVAMDKLSDGQVWQSLLKAVRPHVRPARRIKDCLRRADAAHTITQIGCSRQRVRSALLHMHEIRKRPTVIDLAWMAGVLPDMTNDLIDEWLMD